MRVRAVVAILFLAVVTTIFFSKLGNVDTEKICPLPGSVLADLGTACLDR